MACQRKILEYFYGVFWISIQDSNGASISELDMARDVALAPLAKIEDLPRLGDLPCLPTPPKGFRRTDQKMSLKVAKQKFFEPNNWSESATHKVEDTQKAVAIVDFFSRLIYCHKSE